MFEDPAYHSLIEKILANKSPLLKQFEQADTTKSGMILRFSSRRSSSSISGHLPLTTWSNIMATVLHIDLPWLTLRSKIVQEDDNGILYRTMFDDYVLDNSVLQMVSANKNKENLRIQISILVLSSPIQVLWKICMLGKIC